jgi:hypothetical protein
MHSVGSLLQSRYSVDRKSETVSGMKRNSMQKIRYGERREREQRSRMHSVGRLLRSRPSVGNISSTVSGRKGERNHGGFHVGRTFTTLFLYCVEMETATRNQAAYPDPSRTDDTRIPELTYIQVLQKKIANHQLYLLQTRKSKKGKE